MILIKEAALKNKNNKPLDIIIAKAPAMKSALPNLPTTPVPVANLKIVSATLERTPPKPMSIVAAGMIASPKRTIAAWPSANAFLNL